MSGPEDAPATGDGRAAFTAGGVRKSVPVDRLRDMGVQDTARALALVEELEVLLPEEAARRAALEATRGAFDADLYLLNLAKLAETVPPQELAAAYARPEGPGVLCALLGGSAFLPERIARVPSLFSALFVRGGVLARPDPAALAAEAAACAEAAGSEEQVKAALRRIKLRETARIAARDLARLASLPEVMEDLSALAAATLEAAVRFSRRAMTERFGPPMADLPVSPRRECGFVVLGMGKLGGSELNFSSDIDVVYLYETDRGEAAGGRHGKAVSLHEYFTRMAEMLTRIVSEATADGFVFRVDLRLRPEGSRGDLVTSLRSAEIYYESWGQTWERAAMIKARPVAGDLSVGEEFLRTIAPFVYRKYLDFTAIEEIKEMKERIDAASARARKGGRDLKLGRGGIREIEFFAQAHQLIYGGKNPALRLRGTDAALEALARQGIVPRRESEALREAYAFLRAAEHRIQVYEERQTHVLPEGERDLARLSRAMGFCGPSALLSELDRHVGRVRQAFERLFRGAEAAEKEKIAPQIVALLEPEADPGEVRERLSRLGFADPERARANLAALRDGPPHVRLPARARRYLEKIAPLVLSRVVAAPDPDMALAHMERFLAAVGARTMFYALLYENPAVIRALADLFGTSPFLSGYLLRHPELLDTFLRQDLSLPLKTKSPLRKELGETLAACADFEQEMDELRRFKNLESLRIGMHQAAGGIGLEEAMFQLSALAEVLLQYALVLARREVAKRFGIPAEEGAPGKEAAFCVIGMGKLGAEELAYHSDLDIIFLYSAAGESVPPAAADPAAFRKLANQEYFAKVAQRLISILTTVTKEGYVFRLDTRLRPSGNAGPLVTSFDSFRNYHEGSAQLWERQALLKSRFVAGDREFGRKVEAEISRIVFGRPLPPGAAAEIHRLRTRMEVELGKEREGRLNLKVGRGGLVDVEFAVQYLQLVHGPRIQSVRARGTLKALFELRRAGLLSQEDFEVLDGGYRFLRTLEMRQRLAHDASVEEIDARSLGPELFERYRAETEAVRRVYLRILGAAA